jgi:hypothetical protein
MQYLESLDVTPFPPIEDRNLDKRLHYKGRYSNEDHSAYDRTGHIHNAMFLCFFKRQTYIQVPSLRS